MNGVIYFRADHELIGRVLGERERRRLLPSVNEFQLGKSCQIAPRPNEARGDEPLPPTTGR